MQNAIAHRQVPNAANFDFNNIAIRYDFGLPTNGFELPYNEAQVVFIYNPEVITNPSSISDINKVIFQFLDHKSNYSMQGTPNELRFP